MKKLKCKFTCDLEYYYFCSDFLTPLVKKAKKGDVLPQDALNGGDLVSRLLALCDEANAMEIDLEEALYQRLEEIIAKVKEEETRNEN